MEGSARGSKEITAFGSGMRERVCCQSRTSDPGKRTRQTRKECSFESSSCEDVDVLGWVYQDENTVNSNR